VGITWLSLAYAGAPFVPLWPTPLVLSWLALPLVFLAFVLVVLGLVTPNPAAVGGEGALDRPEAATGILRVTRHPFLTGVALWAVVHFATNGDVRSVVLFGTVFVVAVNGMRSIDHKRRQRVGESWRRYEAVTSAVPGAAIVAGRNRLALGEIGWGAVGIAAAAYVALLVAHPLMFGVSPWPHW
jgi:uncharacterized membrane protein